MVVPRRVESEAPGLPLSNNGPRARPQRAVAQRRIASNFKIAELCAIPPAHGNGVGSYEAGTSSAGERAASCRIFFLRFLAF